MSKIVFYSLALMAVLVAGSASAREKSPIGSPPSTEDCLRHASELADSAEASDMSEDKIDLIEDMLARMEAHCEAKEFVEASALAQQIQNAIDSD